MKLYKWVVSFYGSRIDGVYDSLDQILEKFKSEWGDDSLTLDIISSRTWLSDNEIKIEKVEYFQSLKELRDEKITELLK